MRELVVNLSGTRLSLTRMAWWGAWALALSSDIVSGALRYVLHLAGADWLNYLPKMLVVTLAILALLTWRQNRTVCILAGGFGLFSLIALIQGLPIAQIAFGATIFLPILFGALFWPFITERPQRFAVLAVLGLLVACGGLLWNLLGNIPWAGFSYEIGGLEIEGAREWATFGLVRPSGFARMSATAAIQVMALTLLLYPALSMRSWLLAGIFALFGLAFVALTTTKAAIAATLVMLILTWLRPLKLHGPVLWLVFALSIGVPFTSTVKDYGVDYSDRVETALLASFDQRLTETWPEGLRLISEHSIPLLGLGLSGVGAGNKYFGTVQGGLMGLGVMDNYALYLYGNFGVAGLLFLALQYLAAVRLIGSKEPLRCGMGLALGALLVLGFTTDAVENLLSALIIGIALRASSSNALNTVLLSLRPKRPRRVKRQAHGVECCS